MVLVLAALSALAGCSSIQVATDYNHEFDFATLSTFAWMAGEPDYLRDPLIDTALLDSRIKRDVEEVMAGKGYLRTEEGPDFFIAYHFGTEDEVDVATCGYHYPESPRCWGEEVETFTYAKGTLILDFVEPDNLELVWRGYATGAIYDVDHLDQTIAEAVKKVLAKFPPKH
jgi:hypothetical protein